MKTTVHEFATKDLPSNVEFYVMTENGINAGKLVISNHPIIRNRQSISVEFRENQWMSKPFIEFVVEKNKNKVNLIMKGGADKEAMHLFTINAGKPNFLVKTN